MSSGVSAELYVSLGTSAAIVPEAYLLEGVSFAQVHVLTTEDTDLQLIEEFFQTCEAGRGTDIHVTRVKGFHHLRSSEEHFRFEEVMYRWLLETRTPSDRRYVCLTGGFKTMSAAMQKGAAVLGAADVFHVLAEDAFESETGRKRPPETVSEILEAYQRGWLHWIRLGPESGWPQLRDVQPEHYPLEVVEKRGSERWVKAPDQAFRERLREIVERAHRVAETWEIIHQLPFADLAT